MSRQPYDLVAPVLRQDFNDFVCTRMHIASISVDFLRSKGSQVVISMPPPFAVQVVVRDNNEIEHVDVDDIVGQNVAIGLAETKSHFPRLFRVDAYDDKVFPL